MELDWILEQLRNGYYLLRAYIPNPWFAFAHSAVALFVGYLFGQFALAERLRRNGYDIHVDTDDSGQRVYTVTDTRGTGW